MQDQQYSELYSLIKAAFIEMQELVNTSKENHKFLFSHHDFPKLNRYQDNGMPRLSTFFLTDGPTDFSSLFKSDDEHHYYFERIPSFIKILEYYSDNCSAFMEHPYFRDIQKKESLYHRIFAFDLLEAFDCYMHATTGDEFCEEAFQEILFRLFNRFFQKDLPCSICVPILLTRFEDEEFVVKEGVRIRKLSDSELLSSYSIGGYSDTYELLLVSSATHILELQNYSIENAPVFSPFAWDYVDAYPVEMIDKWFAAYRMVTLHDSGYGQLLSFPVNWGIRRGNLLDVHGVKVQKYPKSFIQKRLDISPTPLVTTEEMKMVSKLFLALENANTNSLNIAVKRLNMAYLRETEEDSILDLMIGIEALVTKEDFSEITYKVSTRTAVLLSTISNFQYSKKENFDLMKKLYRFRSRVVHGEAISEKHRIIKVHEDEIVSSVDLARKILESLIIVIAAHPEFSDPTEIDTLFL